MTRDEAINVLRVLASELRDGLKHLKPEHEKQFKEAYMIAIEALEKYEEAYEHGWTEAECEYRFREHGKWIMVDASQPRRYGCSNCKTLSWDTYDYCPNCGARMVSEE